MANGDFRRTGWSGRGWSRAGAMAVVLQRPRTRRALTYGVRLALHLAACVVISLAVAIMLWNDIGAGPLDVFIGGIREQTGLPLALALYITVALLLAISWLLGRRPGPGNLITPVIMGPLMQIFLGVLDRVDAPSGWMLSACVHLGAVGLAGLGAGAMIVANIGAGTAELLSSATSDQTGQPVPRVRLMLEVGWLATGALLGGPLGFGTAIVAFSIGPAVEHGYRLMDRLVGRTRATTRRLLAPA